MEATLQAVLAIMAPDSGVPMLSGVNKVSTFLLGDSLVAKGYSRSSVDALMYQMDKNRDSFIERSELPDLTLVQKMLNGWDANKDGKVTCDEFIAALSKDMQLSDAQRKMYTLAFQELDANKDGKLSSAEAFGALQADGAGKKLLSDEQLQRVLGELARQDLNGDGRVSVKEFSDAIGPYLTDADLKALLKKVNPNGDAEITFAEYLKDYYLDWISDR